MFGEWIRKTGFYTLDFLKGGNVIRHYKDISDKMSDKKECYNELHDLLRYVKENVPYYSNIKKLELSSFPVVKKSDLKANYDQFLSTEYLGAKLYESCTSGSSGTPLSFSQNPQKRNRVIADLIYHHKRNNWEIGDRYIYLGAYFDSDVSRLKLFTQNFIKIEVMNFNDEAKESMRQVLKKDRKIKVILGYASALESFVDYLEEKGDNNGMFNIKVIFSDSDSLSDKTKKRLDKMFSCPVINRYSNEENGVLACTSPYDNTFMLNRASFYFELLKLDSDEPTEPAELGRIVVTDLYNRSIPFIRYDTGDLATSNDKDRKDLRTLSCLHGRISDLIRNTKGIMVSEVMIVDYFNMLNKLKQFQLSQMEESEYLLKVVCDKKIYNEEFFQNICKNFLGADAVININYTDKIQHEHTGKYKTVINNLEFSK